MSPDKPDISPDEFLDWLCWMWATSGERFYPPDETAEECIENLPGDNHESLGWERGQHTRAYDEAVEKFRDAQRYGFNPIERAAREQHRLRKESENYDKQIDWSWLNDG